MTRDWEALANACDLLAMLWLREVDQVFVEQLNEPSFRQAFIGAGGVAPAAEDLDDLAVEYCRLFIGPRNHLPPYQSVWQRGEFQSEAAVSVRQFAEACYFESPSEQTMMDHLGIELAVMAEILRVRQDARTKLQAEVETMAVEFRRRHLAWCDPLLDAVQQRADSDFYRQLASMSGELIQVL